MSKEKQIIINLADELEMENRTLQKVIDRLQKENIDITIRRTIMGEEELKEAYNDLKCRYDCCTDENIRLNDKIAMLESMIQKYDRFIDIIDKMADKNNLKK